MTSEGKHQPCWCHLWPIRIWGSSKPSEQSPRDVCMPGHIATVSVQGYVISTLLALSIVERQYVAESLFWLPTEGYTFADMRCKIPLVCHLCVDMKVDGDFGRLGFNPASLSNKIQILESIAIKAFWASIVDMQKIFWESSVSGRYSWEWWKHGEKAKWANCWSRLHACCRLQICTKQSVCSDFHVC